MKTQSVIIAAMLLASAMVMASDDACQENGFDYTVGTYLLTDSGYEPQGDFIDGFQLAVVGDSIETNWTSDELVAGVLMNASGETTVLDGGLSGTFERVPDGEPQEISSMTFCADSEAAGVPEFSLVAMAIAIIAVTLGLVILRRN
jgi:hypothetical protein